MLAVIQYLVYGVSTIGILVITWGALVSLKVFIRIEKQRIENIVPKETLNPARKYLTGYLLLGLEFLVAADIMNTIVKPSLQDVAVLGAIVAIRTVLNYFLNLEYKEEAG